MSSARKKNQSNHNTALNNDSFFQPGDFQGSVSSAFAKQMQDAGTSVIVHDDNRIEIFGCILTPVGMDIPADLSKTDLLSVSQYVARLESSLQWLVGDIVAFDEELKYGELKTLAAVFNRSEKTLSNWGSVCRFFEDKSSRWRELSFTHHTVVAGRKDADKWLQKAVDKGWSKTDLDTEIKKHDGTLELPPDFQKEQNELRKEHSKVFKNLRDETEKRKFNRAYRAFLDGWRQD